ncbi:MAG TPA: hypothetical protein VIJ16_05090 [Gemmatimonadaceae bacterium]
MIDEKRIAEIRRSIDDYNAKYIGYVDFHLLQKEILELLACYEAARAFVVSKPGQVSGAIVRLESLFPGPING